MKKIAIIVFTFFVSAASLSAQHYIGVRGGAGAGFGRFYPAKEMGIVWGLYSGGVAWKYYSPDKYIGGVGAEIEFLQRGFEYQLFRNSDTTYRRTLNTINIPLIWQPHINFANNKMRVFLNAGISVSYNISSRVDSISVDAGRYYTAPYDMKLVRDNPFGYGLLAGIGFNIMFGRWEFTAEGRYHFTFGDVLRNTSVYPGNPRRSPIDNINISVGLFYCLNREPHSPLPSPAAVKRRAEREAAKADKKKSKNDGNKKTAKSSETDTEGH